MYNRILQRVKQFLNVKMINFEKLWSPPLPPFKNTCLCTILPPLFKIFQIPLTPQNSLPPFKKVCACVCVCACGGGGEGVRSMASPCCISRPKIQFSDFDSIPSSSPAIQTFKLILPGCLNKLTIENK